MFSIDDKNGIKKQYVNCGNTFQQKRKARENQQWYVQRIYRGNRSGDLLHSSFNHGT